MAVAARSCQLDARCLAACRTTRCLTAGSLPLVDELNSFAGARLLVAYRFGTRLLWQLATRCLDGLGSLPPGSALGGRGSLPIGSVLDGYGGSPLGLELDCFGILPFGRRSTVVAARPSAQGSMAAAARLSVRNSIALAACLGMALDGRGGSPLSARYSMSSGMPHG